MDPAKKTRKQLLKDLKDLQEHITEFYGSGSKRSFPSVDRNEILNKTEIILAESERLSHTGSWYFDIVNNTLSWSDEVFRIFGVKRDEYLPTYHGFFDFVHPDDRERVHENYIRSVEENLDSFEIEHRVIQRDTGKIRFVAERCINLKSTDDTTLASIGMVSDITDIRQAENVLTEKNRMLNVLLDNLNGFAYRCRNDRDWTMEFVSDGIYDLTGYKADDLTMNKVIRYSEIIAEEDRDYVWDYIQKCIEKKEPYTLEYRIKTASGEVKWVWEKGRAVFNDGIFLTLEGFITDITSRKEGELKIEESELHFRHLADHGQALIWTSGIDKKCDYFNKVWLDFTGRTMEEELGDGWTEGVHPDDLERCFNIYSGSFELREKFSMDYRLRHHDGTWHWIQDDGVPRFDRNGRFLGYIGHCLDISERKGYQSVIEEQEEDFRRLFQENPQAMFIFDLSNFRFIEVNPAALDLYGYSREEFLELSTTDIRIKDDIPLMHNIIDSAADKRGVIGEIKHIKKNGEILWVQLTYHDLTYRGRSARHTSISDITSKKESEALLNESEEKNRLFLETMVQGVIFQSEGGFIISANPAAGKILGTNSENLIGISTVDPVWRTIREDGTDFPGNLHPCMLAFTTGQIVNDVIMGVHNPITNHPVWLNITAVPLFRNGEKKPYQVFTTYEDISYRKLKDDSIREQNQRLNAIINALPDLLLVIDADGFAHEFYCSNENMMLVPRDMVIGHNINEVFGQELSLLHIEKMKLALKTGKLVTYQFEDVVNDANRISEARVIPIGTDKVMVFVRDLTLEVKAIHEVKKLSQALTQSPVSIVITDTDGNIEYVNPALCSISGYEESELKGKNMNIFKSGLTSDLDYSVMWKTILKGGDWHSEWINRKKNSELYWEDISISPILDEHGKIVNFLGIKMDITERKTAEKKILDLNLNLEKKVRERTAELENFFSVALDLLCIADLSGNFIKVNKAWENILGFPPEHLEKCRFLDFVHPDDMESTMNAMKELGENKPILSFTNRYRTFTGTYRFIEWHSVPVGQLIYAAARDVTEWIRAEENLEKAKLEAEDANKSKSIFLANMSHEIRTPMNAILGYSELLESLVTEKVQKEFLSSIKTSGKTLLTLINDILDLSKIEAGKLELYPEYVKSESFFNEFEKIFAFRTGEKKISLNTHLSADLPAYLCFDATRLRQVLLNLVSNAVKFTETGEVNLNIYSDNERYKEYDTDSPGLVDLIIEVSDTGIGIEPEHQKKIFDAFYQVKGKSSSGGTGLGLSITTGLIGLMNGTIGLQSVPGYGSKFTIKLPDIGAGNFADEKTSHRQYDYGTIKLKPATILVVDDVEQNRKYIRDALLDTDLTIFEAIDGLNALEVLKEINNVQLIITDIRMPNMDGYRLLEVLKSDKTYASPPIIAYSASVMKSQQDELKRKFDGLLIKPLLLADLYSELARFLQYSGHEDEKPKEEAVNEFKREEITGFEIMISRLENDLYKEWESFEKRQPLGLVRKFGAEISDLGREHTCGQLITYGNDIVSASDSFNIEAILKLLGLYSEIINRLKNS